MKSKQKCIEAVNSLFDRKKTKNSDLLIKRTEEVYEKSPEIRKTDDEIKEIQQKYLSSLFSEKRDEKKVFELKEEGKRLSEKREKLLEKAGFDKNYTDVIYDCEKCKDTGDDGGKICDCYKKALSLEYLKNSKIAPEMQNLSFDDFLLKYYSEENIAENGKSDKNNAKTVLEFAKKYVSAFPENKQNLLFYGTPGAGKTYLSCIIGNELIKKGNFVLYTTLQDMTDVFSDEQFGKSKENDSDIFLSCDLLIIDDLGAEFQTQFSKATLYHVINSRINTKKPFIISTNYSLEEIEENYDPRLSSRIVYGTLGVLFPKVDIRLEKRKK